MPFLEFGFIMKSLLEKFEKHRQKVLEKFLRTHAHVSKDGPAGNSRQ